MKLYRIDDEISVDYNESRQTVGIYDNRDNSPPRTITVLTEEQMGRSTNGGQMAYAPYAMTRYARATLSATTVWRLPQRKGFKDRQEDRGATK